jgi:hypothetical protein
MSMARLVLICGLSLMFLGTVGLRAGRGTALAGGAPAAATVAQDERIVPQHYNVPEVEVLVGGSPLEVLYGRGRRYVEAQEGAEYEVLLRNPLPVRVAVALSVDGLNSIDARRSASWEASKWVVEPYQTIRINGWQMSSRRARRFYFTTERDSYASKLGRAADLGVITAVFYRESNPRPYTVAPPPYDEDRVEPRSRSEAPREGEESRQADKAKGGRGAVAATPRRDDEYAATGIGRSVENDVEWIQMRLERTPAAEVTVRYEYRDALVKLGVLPRPWRDDGALRRRERARGFEGPSYCPEP